MTGAGTSAAVDTNFLERLRAGDEAACEALIRENTGRLLAVARRYLRCEEDARDAVQDAFISALRAIANFQGGSSLSTWLHRIVINACLMKIRTMKRHPEDSIEELLPDFDETGHRVGNVGPWVESAESALARSETRTRVRASIEKLPESYRAVLNLRDIDELSTEETARMLGTTTAAVKVRLHRARQALRTLLEPSFTPQSRTA